MNKCRTKIFILVSFLLLSQRAYSASGSLCDADLEGSFVARFDTTFDVRINLFCTDDERMFGTLAQINAGQTNSFILNLGQAQVDGNDVIVAPFSKELADHRGNSSANTFNYLRIDLAALRQHRVDGVFVGQQGNQFHRVRGTRTQVFPIVKSKSSERQLSPRGVYSVNNYPLGSAKLLFDIVHGAPLATFTIQDDDAIHLTNGTAWTGDGAFNLNNAGGDCGEPGSKKVFNVRGAFISDQDLEITVVAPVRGLVGTFRAHLIQDGHTSK